MLTCQLRRDNAAVAVAADPATIVGVAAECAPWIIADYGATALTRAWTISTGPGSRPAGGGWLPVPTTPPGPGEPRRCLKVNAGQRLIALQAGPGPWAVRFTLRLVRALIRRQQHAEGEMFLHAGAVIVGGAGIAVAAPQRSGKTTTLLALLEHATVTGTPAAFVSNDDLSIRSAGGVVTGHGWPRGVEIRRDMLPSLGGIGARLAAAESAAGATPGSLHLRPSRLAQLAGSVLASSTPLRLLVFPRFARPGEPAHLRRLPAARAIRLLATHLRRPDEAEDWLDPYFTVPGQALSTAAITALGGVPAVAAVSAAADLPATAAALTALAADPDATVLP